ncbi:MAG: winged helix DNA-binding domain-containing protein [Bacteroidales bacterium]
MNPVSIRLLNQQLIGQQFTDPADVVSHLGAIQAQDYRMMRWAVTMRTKKPSEEAFRKAYNSGKIVRMHLLRCTWQLIAAEDYQWMLSLCAPKSMAVLKGWMKSNKITIPEEEHLFIRNLIEQVISDRTDMTKESLANSLAQRKLQMDDHRLSYHIRMAELNGLLVSGDLHPSKATYSLASHKIKQPITIERDEALALLTTKYFQSRCPATLEDYAWWSGLNISDCKKGIQLLGDKLHIESWKGREFYLLEGCRTKGFRKNCSLLLPPFDEYLIGYKSRDIVLSPAHKHHAHNNNGIFYPIIAHDGLICGNWSPYKENLQTQFFHGNSDIALNKNWEEYRNQRIKQK